MSLRINGLSQYIMWESARLFENIGTVNDGMVTLSKPHMIVDKPNALPLTVSRGEIRFEHIRFGYERDKVLLDDFNLTIRAGEKVGLIGRFGAGNQPLSICCCVFMKRRAARFPLMDRIFVPFLKKVCEPKSVW